MPASPARTRFVILCAARTGSTMLRHMLNSHPELRCHGEVLGARRGMIGRPEGADYDANPGLQDQLTELRDRDPVAFLETWVYTPDRTVTGFKVKYEELLKPDFEEVLDWLVNARSIKVIHLTRRNRLKRYVSQIAAVKAYGTYGLTDPGQRPATARLRLSPAECRADFQKQEQREAQFRRRFQRHQVFDVAYEDIADELPAVQRFLGVAPAKLRTPTLKLNPDAVEDVVVNYDQLRRAFTGTRYAAYFEGQAPDVHSR